MECSEHLFTNVINVTAGMNYLIIDFFPPLFVRYLLPLWWYIFIRGNIGQFCHRRNKTAAPGKILGLNDVCLNFAKFYYLWGLKKLLKTPDYAH